jgi:hypothetical protein
MFMAGCCCVRLFPPYRYLGIVVVVSGREVVVVEWRVGMFLQ